MHQKSRCAVREIDRERECERARESESERELERERMQAELFCF